MAERDYRRASRSLEPVQLVLGEILFDVDARVEHVYFPSNSMVSLVARTDGRNRVEVGLVGREGLVGCALALGVPRSPVRALVQGSGTALRMPAAAFLDELKRSASLQREVSRYTYVSMAMAMYIAACNTTHSLPHRLARWLLMTRDRMASNRFSLTQDLLAQMLGTRRATVNEAANALQRRRLISYKRGLITILDANGLQGASCACYEAIRKLSLD